MAGRQIETVIGMGYRFVEEPESHWKIERLRSKITAPMEMLHGQIFALYLFDVAEATDLQTAASAIGSSVRATFAPKPATPAYVRYQQPPLWFEGAGVDVPSIDGFRVGFKVFDYGVISLRLTREFHGTWPELARRLESARRKRSARAAGRAGVPHGRRTPQARR